LLLGTDASKQAADVNEIPGFGRYASRLKKMLVAALPARIPSLKIPALMAWFFFFPIVEDIGL